jgi:hypothetical protein
MPDVREDYATYAPPRWARPTVERLVSSVPSSYLLGLAAIVLTNQKRRMLEGTAAESERTATPRQLGDIIPHRWQVRLGLRFSSIELCLQSLLVCRRFNSFVTSLWGTCYFTNWVTICIRRSVPLREVANAAPMTGGCDCRSHTSSAITGIFALPSRSCGCSSERWLDANESDGIVEFKMFV